jgi:peptidyl-prolyl cis-trans isomerase B (cyclophilin B)
MIQGGCVNTKTPNTRMWGQGQGPRRLDAEFTDTKHERGILSMARSPDVNSASAQFFVMTARTPSLDGQYSVFGKLVAGDETLTSISKAPGEVSPRDGTTRPSQPQEILATTVIWSGKAD